MRIAIVHEWFTQWSGSEQVLEQMLACFPEADLFAVTSSPDRQGAQVLGERRIRTSFVQKLPFGRRLPQLWLPILPLAIEQLDLRGYDLVISNSHCVAKGVICSPYTRHLAYVHSPMRYAWDLRQEYAAKLPFVVRSIWNYAMHRLRSWDALSAMRPDALACNSHYIASRIRHAWNRPSTVIYPPVDVASFSPGGGERDDVYISVSRMVPYKRMVVIARAFSRMPKRTLHMIGTGSEYREIQEIAAKHKNIRLLGHVSRADLIYRLGRARAFIFAAEEDFGIAPVEAQACGTPVIAFARGGATESVIPGVTGLFFHEQSESAIIEAVDAFEQRASFDPDECRKNAEAFSIVMFRERFLAWVSANAPLSEVAQSHRR